MPGPQTPQAAAQAILGGIAAGDFEIHFPPRFTLIMMMGYATCSRGDWFDFNIVSAHALYNAT